MSALRQASLRAPGAATETLSGVVQSVRYYNPRNAWAVLSVHPKAGSDNDPDGFDHISGGSVTVVGSIVNPREGDEYEFAGKTIVDPKYGKQFKAESSNVLLPSTRKGVIRYLASIASGVGEVKAARIVGALGDDCLTTLFNDSSCLDTLGFLTSLQREEIRTHLREHTAVAEVSGLICKEGITPNLAAKVVAVFGEDAARICKEEPYKLMEMDGIGFLMADRIAMAVKIAPDSPARIQAAVRHILSEAQNDGHCYLQPADLVKEVPALLGAAPGVAAIAKAVGVLIAAEEVVRDGDDVYLSGLHEAECKVAEWVKAIASEKPAGIPNLDGQIAAQETNAGVTYHETQRAAVRMALSSGFSVITGQPGTGKSMITKAIVAIHKAGRHTKPVYLCSPTGRAAKRLAEATGHEAKTVHRLLGYIPELGFTVCEEEPLTPGLLIMDEASMADISLARALLAACSSGMQVVLVGDADQLPSVGPGSVLRDIIESGTVPVTRLEFVYRQEEGSEISALAHQINQGITPSLTGNKDVISIEVSNPDEVVPYAMQYAKQAYDLYGPLGFAVLAPMHRGSSGVKALNEAVRSTLNPGEGGGFRLGDRVLVTKNSYKWDIFNGDLGIVTAFDDDAGSMTVDFGDNTLDFGPESEGCADQNLLQLAWASTVHKAQGGEYPVCIVVLTRQHYILLARNMAYTAITRAKKHLVLIHQVGALKHAIANDKIAQRNSRLAERLRGDGLHA